MIACTCARQINACISPAGAHTPFRARRRRVLRACRGLPSQLETVARAASASGQSAAKFGQHGRQLALQRVGRIGDDEPAAVEPVGSSGRWIMSSTRSSLGTAERGERRVEAGDGLRVLDRIPGEIDAGCEPLQALRQAVGQALELALLLERRDRSARRRAAPSAAAAT